MGARCSFVVRVNLCVTCPPFARTFACINTNALLTRVPRPYCSAQDLLNDDDLKHLKLEEKCCNNGCLIVGLLSAEDELRPIVHDAKRLKAEASKRGNQTSVPLHGHNRGGKTKGQHLRAVTCGYIRSDRIKPLP